jgi:hypothetical protein
MTPMIQSVSVRPRVTTALPIRVKGIDASDEDVRCAHGTDRA